MDGKECTNSAKQVAQKVGKSNDIEKIKILQRKAEGCEFTEVNKPPACKKSIKMAMKNNEKPAVVEFCDEMIEFLVAKIESTPLTYVPASN